MSWINPATPNLADYASFLAGVVGVPPAGKAAVFPSAAGSVTAATTTSLTDAAQNWTPGQWNGCTVYDSALSASAVITATTADTVTFAALTQAPAVGDAYIIVQPIAAISLRVALRTVNSAINAADPETYTLAVYNLAADRLLNFAPDQPGQTFFQDARTKFQLTQPTIGVVTGTSDNGTSSSLLNPEWMRKMTLQDLETLRTPYGRAYLGMAQAYGANIWQLA